MTSSMDTDVTDEEWAEAERQWDALEREDELAYGMWGGGGGGRLADDYNSSDDDVPLSYLKHSCSKKKKAPAWPNAQAPAWAPNAQAPAPAPQATGGGDLKKAAAAAAVLAKDDEIREAKAAKQPKDVIMSMVEELKALKAEYEKVAGELPAPTTKICCMLYAYYGEGSLQGMGTFYIEVEGFDTIENVKINIREKRCMPPDIELHLKISIKHEDGRWTTQELDNGRTARSYFLGSVLDKLTAEVHRPTPLRFVEHKLVSHARQGMLTEVTWCLDHGCTYDINYTDGKGFSALVYASQEGHTEVVQMLLGRKADPNLPSAHKDKLTPLLAACQAGHRNCGEALLGAGAELEARSGCNHTPLLSAAVNGAVEALQLLLEHKADVGAWDNRGRTPLMLAAFMGFRASVSALIKGGAALEARCIERRTPLLWALTSPKAHAIDCIQVLIEHGCDMEATCPLKLTSGSLPTEFEVKQVGYADKDFVKNSGGELIERTIVERRRLSALTAESELLAMLDAEEKAREDKKSQAQKKKQKKKRKKNAKKLQQSLVEAASEPEPQAQQPEPQPEPQNGKEALGWREPSISEPEPEPEPELEPQESLKATEEAEAEVVRIAAKTEAALKQDEAWLYEWVANLQTDSSELSIEQIKSLAPDAEVGGSFRERLSNLGALSDLRARVAALDLDGMSSWRLHRSLQQLAHPGKVVTYTVAEMQTWDDDSENGRNAGIVEAWLGTLGLLRPELEALVDVGLDGDDLSMATDELLQAHCKKTAKRHKSLPWPAMRARVLGARDAALGRSANAKRIGKLMIDKGKRLGVATSRAFVFAGTYGDDEQECAVKVMLKADADARSEWGKEVETLLRVKGHRHLIEYIAREEDDVCVYLAMELADGGTLAQRAAEATLGDWVQRTEMCRQLCEGLLTLHNECSVVHRDLKPENVLFKSETTRSREGGSALVLKIADFGLSRSISMSQSRRDTSSGGGTACWIPPEGLRNQSSNAKLTFSYDVHPAGSLMYYILSAGEHAFHGRSETEINTNILKQKYRRQFSVGRADDANEMEQTEALHLISAMLRTNPAERPHGEQASQCMQAVLHHPFFMTPTEKLEQIDALHESRTAAERWTVLEQRSPAHGWRNKLGELVKLAGGGYRGSLEEAARLLRNLRAHLLEKEHAALQNIFGEVPRTVKRRDEVLVKLVGAKVPTLFLALLLM
jgi:serine/threonine protein kinase